MEEYDENFTGTWREDSAFVNSDSTYNDYMRIDGSNSEIRIYCDSTNTCLKTGKGKAVVSKSREYLFIDRSGSGQKEQFKINRLPYQDTNGLWHCVISNTPMVRD